MNFNYKVQELNSNNFLLALKAKGLNNLNSYNTERKPLKSTISE